MWDEEDGFFYDVLRYRDGSTHRIAIRSIVGLLLLRAATVLSPAVVEKFPAFMKRADDFPSRHKVFLLNIHPPHLPGEFQLARTSLDARKPVDTPRPAAVLHILRR